MDRKDNTNYSSSSDAPPAYSEDPDDLPKDDQKEVEQSLKWIPKAPSGRANYTPLARPVAIPQVGVGKRMGPPMPFVRGYSPELAAHDVNKEDFAAFIDNLAIAIAAPAPFQVLQMGSMVAGFVPNGIAQLVSMGVGVAAGAGQAAFIIARSKKYFARVNAEFFHPRGLEVHMKKDPEFCQILGLQGQSLQQVNAATYVSSDQGHRHIAC